MSIPLAACLILQTAGGSVPGGVESFILPNGVTVITRTVEDSPVEGVSIFLSGGSAVLTEETQGIERLAFECAMTGSQSWPGDAWRDLMDRTQARMEGVYSYDYSAIRLLCLPEDLGVLLAATADCLMSPELDPEAFRRIKEGILQDLIRAANEPDERVWLVANGGIFAGHPYMLRPGGTPGSVSAMEAADAGDWLDRRMLGGGLLVVHAGPTAPRDLERMLLESFGTVPPGREDIPRVPVFALERDTLLVEHSEIATGYAVVKFHAPPPDHPDHPLFQAAMDVLSDELWQELRTERGLTYATWAGSSLALRSWGYLYASSSELEEACNLMAGVLSGAAGGGCDPAVVSGTVETSRTSRMMTAASCYDMAHLMGVYQIETGDWRNLWVFGDISRDLDPVSLARVLTDWVGPASWGVVADTAREGSRPPAPPAISGGRP